MGGAISKKSGRYISKFIFLSFCGSIQILHKETLRSILMASGLCYLFFGEWFFSKQEVTFEYSGCQLLTQAVQNHLKYFLQLQLHSKHDLATQNCETTLKNLYFSPLFLGKTCVMPHVCTLKKGKLPPELEFKRLWAWTWLHWCLQQSQQSKPWGKWKLSKDEQKKLRKAFVKGHLLSFSKRFPKNKPAEPPRH